MNLVKTLKLARSPQDLLQLAYFACGLAVSLGGAAPPSYGQDAAISRRSIPAIRLTTAPKIDGDLSDPCWKEAAIADRFTDRVTVKPEPDKTVAYIAYDDANIYIAFHAFDSQPEGIVSQQTKRGAPIFNDDFVAFALDLFHTHQNSDLQNFYVNSNGVEYAEFQQGRSTKLEWEGAWKAAVKIVSDGWTAEMAIPWKILDHPATKEPVTCGIDFARHQRRTNAESFWCYFGSGQLEDFGNWTGARFPGFQRKLSLIPYAAPEWDEKSGSQLRSGLDARYNVTPGLTAVGTINPDFRDVEGAIEGIDFSYGERYVPDRRPFFQEGSNVYGGGGLFGDYFYSRRIPDFDVGANLYGKINTRDTLGILSALNLGHQNDWILKERHNLGASSDLNIGLYNRDDGGYSNRLLEIDENYRKKLWSLNASYSPTWTNDRQTGSAGQLSLHYQSPRWYSEITPHYISPNFKDDLGYIPFTDYKGFYATSSFNPQWRTGPLKSATIGAWATQTDHYDTTAFNHQRSVYANMTTRGDYSFGASWSGGRFEQYDDSVFNVNAGARSSDSFHNYGVSYSFGRQSGALKTFVSPYVTWRFGTKLTLGLTSSILNHQGTTQQHVFTFNYDLTPKNGIVGRIVSQTGGTGGYLAYRRSGYGGVETWLILGDPNEVKFTKRIAAKVVWPL